MGDNICKTYIHIKDLNLEYIKNCYNSMKRQPNFFKWAKDLTKSNVKRSHKDI